MAPLPDESQTVLPSDMSNLRGGGIQTLSPPLPFGVRIRDGLALVLSVVAVACFWKPLGALYSLSQLQEHYSHIILIPWLSLYAFYVDRKAILTSNEWSPLLGSILIAIGAWAYWWADPESHGADYLSITILAFVVICWGLFLFCYGITPSRKVSFGLAFLIFMIPLPSFLLEVIIGFLQRNSADASEMLFSILGVPVFRDKFVFSLSNFTIHVAEECSGIRSALALFITSLVAAHFFLRSNWTKLALVAIVIPLAIVKNAFRIVGLALLANYVDPTFITNSKLHRSGGIPLFLVSLVVLFALVWLFRRLERGQRLSLPRQ